MSHIVLQAEVRDQLHKGPTRRLRRLQNKVPAVIYGGNKDTNHIQLDHNKLAKALESEAIFSSLLTVEVNGKKESVILKDLQRHPFKAIVLHVDFQRVSSKDVLTKQIPLHFINEEKAPGVIDGGTVTHNLNQIEIKCQAKYLPEFIEVDLSSLGLDQVMHVSDIKLPKNVHLAQEHDLDKPVAAIHLSKIEAEEIVEENQVNETQEESIIEKNEINSEATE